MNEQVITRNCRSLRTSVCRRTGVAAVALAALFAAEFSPVATAPVAHADVEDSLGDVIFANLDAALGGQGATGLNAVIDYLSASVQSQIEAAITNPADAQLLDAINFPSVALFGRDLIGNGINLGDPIPALNFLDQSSGPLADTFTGTNEGLLTPELSALHIDVGNLHDGGFLLGDNASGASGASTPADTLPPIVCTGILTTPDFNGLDVVSGANVSCDGVAFIGLGSEIFYNGIPIGIPGIGFGVGSASALTATLGCIAGTYSAGVMETILAVPPYVFPDPVTFHFTPDVPIPCSL